uniref:Phospholipase B-like n=2 Tax=Steinernema glaseri TaxID=37863 RepID=A0A1I8A841_9BILA
MRATLLFVAVLAFSNVFAVHEDDYEDYVNSPKEFTSPLTAEEGEMGRDDRYTYKSACMVDGKLQILHGFDCRNQVAVGRFRNSINVTGWSYLEIETKSEFDPNLQAYAAGLLEGNLTHTVIDFFTANLINDYCTGFKGYCSRLHEYLNANLQWIKKQLETQSPDDPYWQAVNRTFLQLTGIYHGYTNVIKPGIQYDINPILMINVNGELIDLEKKFNKTKDLMKPEDNGKCSGLIKVSPGNKDLFISQVTMSGFESMIRVLKLYKFGYDKKMYPGHTITFSSYPGMLYSSDDFALASSGLAMIETTVNIFDEKLFERIKPDGQLSCWLRAVVANQLARDGREWCEIFQKYNSGTYNNQWTILNYNKFTPGKDLPAYGLLYVLEQAPGFTMYRDITWYLRKYSYFASYNIPFFRKVSKLTGFDKKATEMDWFSWQNAPRARIFRRDHNKVVDLDSLTKLMRYNNYKNDPFSRCNCTPPYTAEAGISARGDLNPSNGTFPLRGMGHVNHGGLDYKGTNVKLFKELRFRAWSGPTYDPLPVFQWSLSDLKDTVKHVGHPDKWDFKAEEYKWETDVRID